MKVYVTKTSFFGVILALGLIGGVRQVAPAQTAAVPDNQVQMVTYFPVPAVSYGNIYIGKKLDIGVGYPFEVTLGDTSCGGITSNRLITDLNGKLPSIWTINPGSGKGTPIFLRHNSVLDLQFSSPVLVKEISLGQQFVSSGSGKTTNTGSATLTFYKLQLGDSSLSPTISDMTANSEIMNTYAKSGTKETDINFPPCPDNTENAQWYEGKFDDTTYQFLGCKNAP